MNRAALAYRRQPALSWLELLGGLALVAFIAWGAVGCNATRDKVAQDHMANARAHAQVCRELAAATVHSDIGPLTSAVSSTADKLEGTSVQLAR